MGGDEGRRLVGNGSGLAGNRPGLGRKVKRAVREVSLPCAQGSEALARHLKTGGEAAKSSTKRKGVSALLSAINPEHVPVEKMKFAKTRAPETNKSINDKTTVFYNAHITLRDIPEEAYAYIVNGKPALELVRERQSIKEDPDSGIVNDANLRATETMGNPKYPLELFLRVITVSFETMKIVGGVPKLDLQ